MSLRHVYFGIESLNLNDAQKAALVSALQALGPDSDPQPARLCHWRVRPDGEAAIFEALFDEDAISVAQFKRYLANICGIAPEDIGHFVDVLTFDTTPTAVVTFSYGGTDYLRVAFFGYAGGEWPTWMESGTECRAYLAANRGEWESDGV